jgi:hypothetical protein
MNKLEEARRNYSTLCVAMVVLVVVVIFCLPQRAAAQQWTTNGNNINSTNSGSVGVGTTTPLSKFDVWSGTSFGTVDGATQSATDSSPFAQNVGGSISFTGRFNSAGNYAGFARMLGVKENAVNGHYGGALVFQTRVHGGNQTEYMRINSTGNIGVGTPAPLDRLHLESSANDAGLFLRNTLSTANATNRISFAYGGITASALIESVKPSAGSVATDLRFRVHNGADWNTSLYLKNDGNVGIGSTNPLGDLVGNRGLQVSSPVTTTLRIHTTAPGKNNSQVRFSGVSGDNWAIGSDIMTNNGSRDFHFYDFAGSPGARITVQSGTGNVGIGTMNPTARLDVQGDINVSGNINAKYQDIAEWVLSSQAIPAGTVVVLDAQNSNQVIASSEPYDTRIAGVVSARPGIALGEAGPDKVLVATTGRVKIKVDATQAAIRIGDLLVTSGRAGYAMKSEPISIGGRQLHAPGTLLGKALEPLEKGTGEILVLLSLQ